MKKLLNISFYVALSVTLLISCKKENEPEATTISLGKITGKIVAANNSTAIKVATLFIQNEGKLYITHSDANGSFVLEAPAGNRHLTIQTGDGSMFRTEMDVVVKEGLTTEIASQAIKLTQVATLAYIAGSYDKIENILVDSMGYTATAITWDMLNNLSNITPYDAIFINCTSEANMSLVSPVTDNNLADYVANGGSLYVSDYAVKCLVGKHTSSSNPCNIERVGGFIADSLLCVRKTGVVSTVMNAPIASSSLQAYLNKTTIDEIVYNLPSWEKINFLDVNFWETMVTDPTGNPLLIRTNEYTNPSKGSLSIGSTVNNGYSLVCVSGTGNQHSTLSVKTSDVPALLANGATSGMCDNLDASGRIYYTTFHNEPNGLIGVDMRNILEFVILNL
jgi:hypothetical protein